MTSKTPQTAADITESAAKISAAVSAAKPIIEEALGEMESPDAAAYRDTITHVAADHADKLTSEELTAVIQRLQDAFGVTPENRPAEKPKRQTRSTSKAGQPAAGNGVSAKDLQSEAYTVGQLRSMVRTTKNAETKKLVQAEIQRRADLAQAAAKAKNKAAVKPEQAKAAVKASAAVKADDEAATKLVMDYLKANPAASAPAVFKATGVTYSRVRKIAEANGHRFGAQDRTAAAKLELTAAQIKALRKVETDMGHSLTALAAALRRSA